MQGLSISLFGETALSLDGVPVVCPSKKALVLFVYVALRGGRQPRRDLARLLWGSANEEAARTSLRTALQRLPAPMAACLAIERDTIALLAPVDLDTARFATLAQAGDLDSLTRASDLYGGALLGNLELDATPEFDDWLYRERARFLQIAQSVFDRLIEGHRTRAQLDSAHAGAERESAIAAARRWVALDPASETAHRWLMQLFFETGQREAAMSQYEVCQRELAVAFGRGPSAETRALFEAIGAPLLSRATQAAPAIDASVRAPELAGTSFVGRIEELAALERLFADPRCRLLTLHGLGGMGKSRLAFALCAQIGARYAQGATWVALASVAAPAQLAHAVAAALGFELPAQPEPGTALCAALRSQERLLVLDNFEHLIADGAAQEWVLALLREAPGVRLLVTSREVLGLQEEWVYELTGLAYPSPDVTADSAAAAYPAVELFVQRARQAYLGFSPQAEWPNVVRLCRLTEGLPLALELAAAWVRTIPCADLVQAIDTEMSALATRHRNRPERQRSLDAVVRTSWSLLARDQQQALAALSVFVGGFTHEAAHAVADAPLRILSALVDKSLVLRRDDGRLGLHELVRQFAAGQLASRGAAARVVRRRHAGFFAALLGRWRARIDGPEEIEASAALGAEMSNLMSAADLWLDRPGASIDQVAEAMLRLLIGRGLFRETLATASRVLDAGAPVSPATQAMVLAYRARARCLLADLPAAQADFDAAIALGRAHGLGYPLAYALLYSQAVAFIGDRLEAVQRQLEEIEPMLATLADASLTMRARFNAGIAFDASGQPLEAERALREALVLARKVGSPSFIATVQSSLAPALLKQGRLDEGEVLLRESLGLFERIGSRHNIARVLNSLAVVTLWRSDGAQASAAAIDASRACELFERVGYAPGHSAALDTLGQALAALGRADEARALFERAASLGGPILRAEATFHLALLEMDQGRLPRARQLAVEHLDAAERHRLPVLQRTTVLLAAGLAAREHRSATARRWLRSVLAEPDPPFDEKRLAEKLAATLAATLVTASDDGPVGPTPTVSELMPEVRAFLLRDPQ